MNWTIVIVACVFFVAFVYTKPDEKYRRSLTQLYEFVTALTNRSAIEFLEYGNYCGPGGKGNATDKVDECCLNHDKCYTTARERHCPNAASDIAYHIKYDVKDTDNEIDIMCLKSDATDADCKFAVCDCDLRAAKCLAQAPYNKENKKSIFNIIIKAMEDEDLGKSIIKLVVNTIEEAATETQKQT